MFRVWFGLVPSSLIGRYGVPSRALSAVLAAMVMTSAAHAQSVEPGFGQDRLRAAIANALNTSGASLSADNAAEPSGVQPAQPPPTPAHTGLAALAYETLSDFKAYPRRESTWVILGAGGALAAAAHPADKSLNRHLVGSSAADKLWKPGNYIGGVGMAVAPVAIYVLGRYVFAPAADEPQTNKWSHIGFDLVRAQIVDEAFVQAIKFSVRRERPNGSKYSFPSGHAAATFAFASVLERHFGYRFAWPTVVVASYVATSRLHDNVHYLSDVVFGAALGTTVGWTVVGRHGKSSYALVPGIGPHSITFTLARTSASSQSGDRSASRAR